MGGGGESIREVHDFSNVASFSELPFLRSAPPRESPNSGIRIFGIDVPHSPPERKAKEASTTTTAPTTTAAAAASATQSSSGGTTAAVVTAATDSSRKFECHYCCRNFPTSQALGGHQNAHKRERQHAKHAQFQTAMAMHHHSQYYYPHAVPDPSAHLYPAFAAYRHHHGFAAAPPPAHYPSWAGASRYYSGPGSISQPINGSPVTPPPSGLWQRHVSTGAGSAIGVGTPAAPLAARRQAEQPVQPLAILGGEEPAVVVRGAGSAPFSPSTSSSSSSASPHKRPAPPEPKEDNVSLDLSL